MTKLFDRLQVSKFFDILDSLAYTTPVDTDNYRYKGYKTIYTEASNHNPCAREVFVQRTLNKWLKGKYLVLYKESDMDVMYKQYISITQVNYQNDREQGYLDVGIMDYSKPYDTQMFKGLHIKLNDALKLEGEWSNGDIHNTLLGLVSMKDVPDKGYTFKAYDWAKYPKGKSKKESLKTIEFNKVFIAKTEKQAYKLKNEYVDECMEDDGNRINVGELIKVKEL